MGGSDYRTELDPFRLYSPSLSIQPAPPDKVALDDLGAAIERACQHGNWLSIPPACTFEPEQQE